MIPKGKLLIIGGGEDLGDRRKTALEKENQLERLTLLRELLPKSKNHRIEVITTGSSFQNKVKKTYQKAFRKIGYMNPGFIPIKDKIEASDKEYLKRVKNAAAIFFTGGDQFRIATILGGSKLIKIIKYKYWHDPNFLIAGTSAGAMVMSSIMITSGGLKETLVSSDLITSSGLGILQNCIIDSHFIKRARFSRLAHAIIINPDQLGIGLGEDTALIIKNGSQAECRGSGMVVIIDGQNIKQTNISIAKENEPIYVENLRVHLLVRGCRFSIKSRKLYKPILIKPNKLLGKNK